MACKLDAMFAHISQQVRERTLALPRIERFDSQEMLSLEEQHLKVQNNDTEPLKETLVQDVTLLELKVYFYVRHGMQITFVLRLLRLFPYFSLTFELRGAVKRPA